MENNWEKNQRDKNVARLYAQQFADSVDISKPMVSYIESGKKTPSRETVSKFPI